MTSSIDYVPQINQAFEKANASERSALTHAFECGKLLWAAREAVKAEKKATKIGWQAWVQINLPRMPYSTAMLYLKLYEYRNEIEQAGVTTITGALRWKKEAAPEKASSNNTEEEPEKEATEDDDAPDDNPPADPVEALDENDRELVAVQWLVHRNPRDVFDTLVSNWEKDNLIDLTRLLVNHLRPAESSKPLENQPPVAPPPPPPLERLSRGDPTPPPKPGMGDLLRRPVNA